MATVFIPKSTTDLGGAGVANGDDVVFGEGQQSVITNLNAWAAFAGLNSINFDPRFTGTVGGGSAGSLLVDVDSATSSLVSYAAGGGALYLAAAGPDARIYRLKVIGNGQEPDRRHVYSRRATLGAVEHQQFDHRAQSVYLGRRSVSPVHHRHVRLSACPHLGRAA